MQNINFLKNSIVIYSEVINTRRKIFNIDFDISGRFIRFT